MERLARYGCGLLMAGLACLLAGQILGFSDIGWVQRNHLAISIGMAVMGLGMFAVAMRRR